MSKKDTFIAKVGEQFDFELDANNIHSLDMIPNGEGRYHILKDGKSYQARVISINQNEKHFVLEINGTEHEVQLSDQYDQLIQKMGLNVASSSKMNDLKAPMPGLVLDILVEEGQSFEKGDALLILEAMKMENIIKATGEGTVKKISVSKTDAVDKGQILLELE